MWFKNTWLKIGHEVQAELISSWRRWPIGELPNSAQEESSVKDLSSHRLALQAQPMRRRASPKLSTPWLRMTPCRIEVLSQAKTCWLAKNKMKSCLNHKYFAHFSKIQVMYRVPTEGDAPSITTCTIFSALVVAIYSHYNHIAFINFLFLSQFLVTIYFWITYS